MYLAGCLGDSLRDAREKVYAFLAKHEQPEFFCRTDIVKSRVYLDTAFLSIVIIVPVLAALSDVVIDDRSSSEHSEDKSCS